MASDKVDMSLDDIIKQQRTRGGGRGGGRGRGGRRGSGSASGGGRGFSGSRIRGFGGRGGRFGGSRGVSTGVVSRGGVQKRRGVRQPAFTRGQIEGKWQHDLFRSELTKAAAVRDNGRQGKLLISNLDFGVNDSDITELFTEFGPLRKASVHYDRSGRSIGTAEVLFEMKADAVKALQQYNNVPLDGRPMKIQLVGEGSSQTSPRPASAVARTGGPSRQGNFRQSFGQRGRGRGRGRGGRGGRDGSAGRSNLTKEQLDAQLDAYKMDIN